MLNPEQIPPDHLYRTTLQRALDGGLCVLDQNGTVLTWGPELTALVGVSPIQACGHPWPLKPSAADDHRSITDFLEEAATQGATRALFVASSIATGSRFVEVAFVALPLEQTEHQNRFGALVRLASISGHIDPPMSEQAHVEGFLKRHLTHVASQNLVHARLGPQADSAEPFADNLPISASGNEDANSARTQRDPSLHEALVLQQAILNCAASSIIATDPNGVVVIFNRAAERLLGYRADEVIGRKTPLLWHDEREMQRRAPLLSRELCRKISVGFEVFTAKAAGGQPDTNDWTYIHRHGGRRMVELTVTALRNDQGNITGYLGVATDITERKVSDEALKASEERVRLANQFAGVGIWDWNVKANQTYWDDQMFAMYGMPKSNPVPYEDWLKVAFTEDLPPVETALRRVVELGQTQDYEFRIRRADTGELRYLRGACGPVFNDQGRVMRVVGINFDITDRKHYEESIRQRESLLRAIFDSTAAGVSLTDSDGKFVSCNPAFANLVGVPMAEIVGRSPRDFTHPDDWAHQHHLMTEMRNGQRNSFNVRKRYVRADGTFFWTQLSVTAARDDQGQFQYGVGISFDVTDQQRLEEQFRQAQKMEAIGRIAGGIAHDFNNLLTVISNQTEVLRLQLQNRASHESLTEPVDAIKAAGERATSLTRQLLAYSRKQMLSPAVLDLNLIIQASLGMLHTLVHEGIRFDIDLEPRLHSVRVDRGQLEQVLLNLTLNARDAIEHTGRIRIVTRNVVVSSNEHGQPVVEMRESRRPVHIIVPNQGSPREFTWLNEKLKQSSDYVMLSVQDTGSGIKSELLPEIFEPFVTTKEKGQGTGLGLAVVYGVVTQSRGFIEIITDVGQGTTFSVYLPSLPAQQPREMTPEKKSEARGGERVYLVEDDGLVRTATRLALEAYGYRVVCSKTSSEARDELNKDFFDYDLLLTDVMMPEVSGCELADLAVKKHSHLKVLLVSGYSGEDAQQRFEPDGRIRFLPKPFTPDLLARTIRELLKARE